MTQLRHLKILMKNSLLNKRVEYEIAHSAKNIVDLDISDPSDDSSDSDAALDQGNAPNEGTDPLDKKGKYKRRGSLKNIILGETSKVLTPQ